jgi:high-affinity Fe2+/Pb2+ permease
MNLKTEELLNEIFEIVAGIIVLAIISLLFWKITHTKHPMDVIKTHFEL